MHHRTWGVGLGAVCAVVIAGLLVTSAAAAPLVSSTFNRTTEGWLVAGDSTSANPTRVATGGNPGGYISAEDSVAGGITYWVAPAKFRGDQGDAYGGLLTFSLRQDNNSNQFDADDVIIEGDGLTLVHNNAANPAVAPNWTTYRVRLRPAQFTKSGGRVTARNLQDTLGSITDLRIRAEYVSGPDTDDLDNVRLLPPGA
jgi:Laminin B (Domain IV)